MKRRLFTIVSALSLLLFVAVVVLWVRSHRVSDRLGWHDEYDEPDRWGERDLTLVSSGGGLRYTRYEIIDTDAPEWLRRLPQAPSFHGPPVEVKPVGFRWQAAPEVAYPYTGNTYFSPKGNTTLGFGVTRIDNDLSTEVLGKRGRTRQRLFEVVVPFWSLALAVVLPIAVPTCLVAFRSLRRNRRAGAACCPSCGYDLRATPGRCPECGAAARESASR